MKIDNSFYKVMDTINRVNNIEAAISASGTNTKQREPKAEGASQNAAKRKWVEVPSSCYFA